MKIKRGTFVGVGGRGSALFLGRTKVFFVVLILFLIPFPCSHCSKKRVSLTSSSESRKKRELWGKQGYPDGELRKGTSSGEILRRAFAGGVEVAASFSGDGHVWVSSWERWRDRMWVSPCVSREPSSFDNKPNHPLPYCVFSSKFSESLPETS